MPWQCPRWVESDHNDTPALFGETSSRSAMSAFQGAGADTLCGEVVGLPIKLVCDQEQAVWPTAVDNPVAELSALRS